MENEVYPIKDIEMPDLMNRIQHIENKVDLINMKLQSEPGLPGFEFYIEAEGEEIWSGIDLQTHYPKIMDQYPDKALIIKWRSFPVTLL